MLHPTWAGLKLTWEHMRSQNKIAFPSGVSQTTREATLTKAVMRKYTNATPAITGVLGQRGWLCTWQATTQGALTKSGRRKYTSATLAVTGAWGLREWWNTWKATTEKIFNVTCAIMHPLVQEIWELTWWDTREPLMKRNPTNATGATMLHLLEAILKLTCSFGISSLSSLTKASLLLFQLFILEVE